MSLYFLVTTEWYESRAHARLRILPIDVQTSHAGLDIYLYFSFVTLTTVGYGDYTAANGLGRSLASMEALLGQIYLVTVVALIVGSMTRSRSARLAATSEPTDAPAASTET